jgi:hypothetical protein
VKLTKQDRESARARLRRAVRGSEVSRRSGGVGGADGEREQRRGNGGRSGEKADDEMSLFLASFLLFRRLESFSVVLGEWPWRKHRLNAKTTRERCKNQGRK